MRRIKQFFTVFRGTLHRQGARKALRWGLWVVLRKLRLISGAPKVSVIMQVCDTRPEVLRQSVRSIMHQTYTNWELCICDNGSTRQDTLGVLEKYREMDVRNKVIRSDVHLDVENLVKFVIEFATGNFVCLLRGNDIINYNTFQKVVAVSERHTQKDIFYCDISGEVVKPGTQEAELSLFKNLDTVINTSSFVIIRKKKILDLKY